MRMLPTVIWLNISALVLANAAGCQPSTEQFEMKPTLYRVILPVTDIDRAEAFYSTLLGMPGERVSPGRHYFNCNGIILACFDPQADGDDFEARALPGHLYFAVDDLETRFKIALTLNCERIDKSIKTQPWGERSFYATDPFGNRVCIVDRATVFTGLDSVEDSP